MKLTNGFDISSSALTAQRFRMDVISSNMANADTTRGKLVDGRWVPYQRKIVSMEAKEPAPFSQYLQASMNSATGQGVRVSRVFEDEAPFKQVYNPTHPDADERGYVQMPNVDILKEMVDLMSATRSYEANVTALNATKSMITKALEIGK
ncbi:flagellar basal body rod protein FlgC [Paenibacillus flagellatus]|uniref:Flagellar basal-body rod protein FlgC n=1 Tax=Paenibacillus flagellatus TaxID=2211139 RepID=A0A2V5JYW1_9BACL|nr:flagellar basal body rod protein FlgC [Paenibacillus flagellatus]PYI50363.1 flagellar basal body rod protein FlgC [Paenibacillus flagellatus]